MSNAGPTDACKVDDTAALELPVPKRKTAVPTSVSRAARTSMRRTRVGTVPPSFGVGYVRQRSFGFPGADDDRRTRKVPLSCVAVPAARWHPQVRGPSRDHGEKTAEVRADAV